VRNDTRHERRFNAAVAEHGYCVPENFIQPLRRYVIDHTMTGDLLHGILIDNWWMAIMHAHTALTVEDLKAITRFVWDAVPPEARGSHEAVKAWVA